MPQSLSNVLLHLVFSTKNRHPFIDDEIDGDLYAYMAGVFKANDCPAVLIGGAHDHIHALCNLSRTTAVSDLVQEVKTASSKWMKAKGARYQGFSWQAGYGVFSVSQSSVDRARAYIACQREHHTVRTFQDEFRHLLRQCGVAFDERYVWD